MINVLVSVPVRQHVWTHWLDFSRRHAEASSAEPGCQRFDLTHDAARCRSLLLEQFADAAALSAHRASGHYRRWAEVVGYYEESRRTHLEWPDALDGRRLTEIGDLLRGASRRVVWANGVFDLLGSHHAAMLAEARRQGDWLVVGVNDDASAGRMKPGRPVRPLTERLALLAALRCVDAVVPYGCEDELESMLERLRPDVMCKGEDWRGRELTGQRHAGRVHWCRLVEGQSTTRTLDRIRAGAAAPAAGGG